MKQASAIGTVDITVLVCVYNGGSTVSNLLFSALAQDTADQFAFEILVIDNNSTDTSPALIAEAADAYAGTVRSLKESRQGKSYALNSGLAAARGHICCVIDQDERLPAGYLRQVWDAFQQHPDVSFLSGKVLPLWPGDIPAWITREHWSPLAICDYGDESFVVNRDRLVCLLAGCFRTADMRAVGGYREQLGIMPGRLGSVEDADLYERLVAAGRVGLYVPGIVLYHELARSRLSRAYHRRWHRGHGGYFAEMRSPDFESSPFRLLQVPNHIFHGAARDASAYLTLAARGYRDRAFSRELRLRFCVGFVLRRWGMVVRRWSGVLRRWRLATKVFSTPSFGR